MEIAAKLKRLLDQTMSQDHDLIAWRFNLFDTQGLEVGLKNNQIGGPYSAPSFKRSISGDIYLVWANQRFTSAKLDAQTVECFSDNLNLWKTTAYYDVDGVGLFNPDHIPDVPLTEPRVQQIIAGDFHYPFMILNQGLKRLREYGLKKVDGKIRCYQECRVFKNSDGLSLEYLQTPVDLFFEVNDSYGESFSEKRLPTAEEVERIIENTGKIGCNLLVTCRAEIAGPIQLIFPPNVFESFVNHFLISNLLGSLVINRQSSFTLEDFYNHHQVLRDDLTLEINTLLPFRAFSYPCTMETVPGGSVKFIAGGRLQTPVLNLKYARKTGDRLCPTPVPSGGRGFFVKSELAMVSLEEMLKTTDLGLIVYSVLGLHTQDASSGKFSLTADQCLLVKDGAVTGKVKAVISGDFLGALKNESSQFAIIAGEDNPAFKFIANAAV